MTRLSSWALAALVVIGLSVAAGAAQTIIRVSEAADGSGGGGFGPVAVSDDGRFVAFRSGSNSLVPGDTNNANDIFVKDMRTGAIKRVSVSSGGAQANSSSGDTTVDISGDGRFVLFDSTASNLVAGDTNSQQDMFIHDRQTGVTERIVRNDGVQSAGRSVDGAISGNGRFVAFAGRGYDDAGLIRWGIQVYDRVTKQLERVTDGTNFNASVSYLNADISDDGRYVAFVTTEFSSNHDIILYDRQTNAWQVANPRLGGAAPQSRQEDLALSGDGRFVTFGSPDTNYVAGDSPDTNDVFVFDAAAGTLERIPGGGATVSQDPVPVISGDGRYVAFASGLLDLYGAANGVADVVVFDRQNKSGEVVSVYDDGTPATKSSGSHLFEAAISGDGRFVVFSTFEDFDSGDNTGVDFYIVDREGKATPPGACEVEFTDVDESNIFASDICWLAQQGITRGCNPPVNDRFCPNDRVTRGQMAAFLVRALGYTDDGGGNLFVDDDGSVFEGDIDRLGTAGVTRGCNPPANDRFCPNDQVTRQQMAAFLRRALDQ